MGNHGGGIADLGATLREYREAVEADFHKHYGVEDLYEALAERGCRWVYGRIKHLPPDAALWRVLQAGEEVPSTPETIRTTDKKEIDAFFDKFVS